MVHVTRVDAWMRSGDLMGATPQRVVVNDPRALFVGQRIRCGLHGLIIIPGGRTVTPAARPPGAPTGDW